MSDVQVTGGDWTKQQMEGAAEDARNVIADSPIIQSSVAVGIAARQLYMIARQTIDQELAGDGAGWELDDAGLVIQTLAMSMQERANEKFTAKDLQQTLLQTVVPYMDIFVRMEADHDAAVAAVSDSEEQEEESDE